MNPQFFKVFPKKLNFSHIINYFLSKIYFLFNESHIGYY